MSRASTLATPRPFEFGGKTYLVSAVDGDMEGEYQVWLEGQALDGIERHRPRADLSVEAGRLEYQGYLVQHEQWRREIAAGTYEYGGPVATVSLFRPDGKGNRHLLCLQLQRKHPEVTPVLVEQIRRDPSAWTRLLAIQGALNADPAPGTDPKADGGTTPDPASSAS